MGMVLARWLLLLLLVLFAVEVVLAWRFGHYTGVTAASEAPPVAGRLLPAFVGFIASTLFLVLVAIFLHAAWTGDFLGFLPDAGRRAMEERLGVPAPAAGEGTRWHLEFVPYFWDTATDPWLSGVVALAMSLLVLGVYFREGTTTGSVYKLLLAALRLFLILLTLVVLLPQLRLSFERESWPDVAIVIDDSRSMSTADRYRDARAQEAAERLVREVSVQTPQRLQLAQALLAGSRAGWLESLLTRRRVKLHIYHCSHQAARVADVTEPGELQAAAQAIQQLRAEGDSSQLGSAVRQVLNDFRGSSLAAILMLTDGVTTEGEDLAKVSHYAAQMGVPLFFVGLGDVHLLRNLQLHDLQVEDTVHVNDRLVFEARLTAQGQAEPHSIIVTLSEKDKSGRLKRLTQENVTTDPRGKPVKFRLLHRPTEPGEKLYVIEALTGEDSGGLGQSSRLERTILVQEAKVIKVLYIEGYARYEYRYLKHLLERESNQDKANKSVDLKVLLIDADPEYASEDKSAVPDFPTKEELNAYDVVLLGDVDPKDKKIGERNLQNLAEFVKERGGGLLMIAGPRNDSPHAYKNMPLAEILPVQIGPGPAEDVARSSGFRPEITAAGRFHPMLRFNTDETENSAVWSSLPELHWWSEGYRQQPAAEALLVHPQRPAAQTTTTGTKGAERHPLLLQQFVGAGRSMFLGFDETWRWRFRDNEPHFNQFWIQTIRHLARNRTGRIELHLDRQNLYRRGEPIRVTVRFPDDATPPAPDAVVDVILTRTPLNRTGLETPVATELQKETLRLAKVEGSRASYEAIVSRTPEGEYRFRLSTPLVADPKPEAECRVLPPPGEMEDVRLNQAELEKAAAESRGRFYTLAEADQFLNDLPTGPRITVSAPQPPRLLWNHYSVFGLVIGLLGSEWILRKRRHLP
jgi:hypothetical protein